MTSRSVGLGLAVLWGCRSPSATSVQPGVARPASSVEWTAPSDASAAVGHSQSNHLLEAAVASSAADVDGDGGREEPLPTHVACGKKPMPLPHVWEDAYTLSRKQIEEGVSITVVGRVRDVNDRGVSLEAVCRSSESPLEVAFVTPACGVVGETLVVRGVVQARGLLTALASADGPVVTLVDGAVLGTTSVQQVCKARSAKAPQRSEGR